MARAKADPPRLIEWAQRRSVDAWRAAALSTSLNALDRFTGSSGRIGLLERAEARTHQSALALASVTSEAARQNGGRLCWAGHVDQIFIGDEQRAPNQALVSVFPSKRQATLALATRLEWGIEHLVHSTRLAAFEPAPALARMGASTFLRLQGWLGRKTPMANLGAPGLVDELDFGDGSPAHRPTPEALRSYVECGIEGKVVMLNLLRFARDESGDASAGRTAYMRYGRRSAALIGGLGGRLRVQGRHVLELESGADVSGAIDTWDALALVEYPSRADFIGMIGSSLYTTAHADRDAGLERTELLVCTSHAEFF